MSTELIKIKDIINRTAVISAEDFASLGQYSNHIWVLLTTSYQIYLLDHETAASVVAQLESSSVAVRRFDPGVN